MSGGPILVVEPDHGLRGWLRTRLEQAGHRVIEVAAGEAALQAAEREQPEIAILGELPAVAGPSLLERLLARVPRLTALAVSPDDSVCTGVAAMKQGAIDFLTIPCRPEVFDAAVANALKLARTRRHIAETGVRREAIALVGRSPAMLRVRDTVERLAVSDATTVLLQGETGTGKEVVAHAIHALGARAGGPFLKVNCAALPEALIEAELFGHEKGAFTTAREQRAGIFEAARGGTVLLDEIGDLPASQQASLLRLLENRTFRRVGGVEERTADVRVIAATHANLEDRARAGTFRADLFFRLNVVTVELPPLRERRGDIAALAAWFVARFNERLRRSVRLISLPALEALEAYDWPGNVRELRNVVERAFILHPWMEELRPCHLGEAISRPPPDEQGSRLPAALPLAEAERWLLADAMRRCGDNQVWAARSLGISRFTLRYRLRKYGLRAAGGPAEPPRADPGVRLESPGHASGEVC